MMQPFQQKICIDVCLLAIYGRDVLRNIRNYLKGFSPAACTASPVQVRHHSFFLMAEILYLIKYFTAFQSLFLSASGSAVMQF